MARYATTADRAKYGIKASAFASFTSDEIQDVLDACSDVADTYLGAVFVLPLGSWSLALTSMVCHLADYDLMSRRGFNPEDGNHQIIVQRKEQAIRWLESVRDGKSILQATDSSSSGVQGAISISPTVESSTQRGWSVRGTDTSARDFVND